MKLYLKSDIRWHCNVKNCHKQVSIQKGTWLEDSNIVFLTAIRFIYCWCKELTTIEWGKEQ
ncbi:hypothetical protein X975_00544, partial [Stegodyphus mimosarum]